MGENFSELVENKIFAEKTFCSLVPLKDATLPNFDSEELSRIAVKPQNLLELFLPRKCPTIYGVSLVIAVQCRWHMLECKLFCSFLGTGRSVPPSRTLTLSWDMSTG